MEFPGLGGAAEGACAGPVADFFVGGEFGEEGDLHCGGVLWKRSGGSQKLGLVREGMC